MIQTARIWVSTPESPVLGLDRSDRRENAPKTGKIVKIAGSERIEGLRGGFRRIAK
jgi:hypothetical protein